MNRIRFFVRVVPHIWRSDAVYMFDWFAAGMPAMLAARLLRKPYAIRVGGDYLWEQRYLESGATPISLREFYDRSIHLQRRYVRYFRLIRRILGRADRVVFNSDVQRELYIRHYGLSTARTLTINNPVPRIECSHVKRDTPSHEIVFWGRFIVMKNLDTLVRAFAKAALPASYTMTLIGDGPRKPDIERVVRELHLEQRVRTLPGMPLHEVLERVKNARAFVLPSWTDIAPNQVFEALAIGLPSLVTKENYLPIRDQLPETLDPSSIDDCAVKLWMLSDDERYEAFSRAFTSIRFDHTWEDVVRAHETLLTHLV